MAGMTFLLKVRKPNPIPCTGLKSLDGHERGPQGTDLDEKFGTPIVFRGDSETRNHEADFGTPGTENSTNQNFVFSPDTLFFRLDSIPHENFLIARWPSKKIADSIGNMSFLKWWGGGVIGMVIKKNGGEGVLSQS